MDRKLEGTEGRADRLTLAERFKGHYALGALTVIYAFNYFDRNIFSIVLPGIKAELEISDSALGLVGGLAFVMLYSVLGVPFAYIADRYNRRNLIAAGLAFWSLMTAATGLAQNVWHLALTRFLMGAGEATNVSPSNAMVADLYAREKRPAALSILNAGSSVGVLLGFVVGGFVMEYYNWRVAFFVAGLPGLAVALLFFLTVKEPVRGQHDSPKASLTVTGFLDTLRYFGESRTYVFMVLGGCFTAVFIYAGMLWNPTFLMRVHQLTPSEVGLYVGLLRGPFGLLGIIVGGLLAQRLGKRDPRWQCWVPAAGCILAVPAEFVYLFADAWWMAVAGLVAAAFFGSLHTGPFYAVLQSISKVRMRAMAPATFLLCANLVGQTIGPWGAGFINDLLAPEFGVYAIRYSLMAATMFTLVGGFVMLIAARTVEADTRRALET